MHWTLGILIGLPIVAAIIAAIAAASAWLWPRRLTADSYDRGGYTWGAIGCWVLIGILVVGTAGFTFPWTAQYHQWRDVDGTVTKISSRILSDGNGTVNQRFVVQIGDGRLYGCDDTRCSTVKVGDRIHLSCIREWQYASDPGYGCRWRGNDD